MKIHRFAIIIGVQKGGTTSLFNYLSQHPNIARSRLKETNFFSKEKRWQRGLDYYEKLWQWDARQHTIALEGSPSYTRSLEDARRVIGRIKATDAEFKFIYILRDPIKRIASMREHGSYAGWYTKQLAEETQDSLPLSVIESVSYATMADEFVNAFSKKNLLLLKTEDLKEPTSAQNLMVKTCDFLGIDSQYNFSLGKVHNAKNSYRKDTAWSKLKDTKNLGLVKNLAPEPMKNYFRALLSKPSEKQAMPPPLTEQQKGFILDKLESEFSKLETQYNFDLSGWGQRRTVSS